MKNNVLFANSFILKESICWSYLYVFHCVAVLHYYEGRIAQLTFPFSVLSSCRFKSTALLSLIPSPTIFSTKIFYLFRSEQWMFLFMFIVLEFFKTILYYICEQMTPVRKKKCSSSQFHNTFCSRINNHVCVCTMYLDIHE